jgi:hypothetical protein
MAKRRPDHLKRSRHSPEQIVRKLRESDWLIALRREGWRA